MDDNRQPPPGDQQQPPPPLDPLVVNANFRNLDQRVQGLTQSLSDIQKTIGHISTVYTERATRESALARAIELHKDGNARSAEKVVATAKVFEAYLYPKTDHV